MERLNISDLQSLEDNLIITITGNDLIDLFNEFKKQLNTVEKEDKLLTPKAAADMLNIDVATLWQWKKRKILIPSTLGNTVRYKQGDIERLIKKY